MSVADLRYETVSESSSDISSLHLGYHLMMARLQDFNLDAPASKPTIDPVTIAPTANEAIRVRSAAKLELSKRKRKHSYRVNLGKPSSCSKVKKSKRNKKARKQ